MVKCFISHNITGAAIRSPTGFFYKMESPVTLSTADFTVPHCFRKGAAGNELPGVPASCQLLGPQHLWTTVTENSAKLLAFSHFPS